MMLAFEGTGNQVTRCDLRNYTGPRGGRSFVWRCIENSNDPISEYFPGPNPHGSNCDDILDDAISYFEKKRKVHPAIGQPGYKISLFGYSRGAYIAMCFAKYLQTREINVHFLGMFDAVMRDVSIGAPYCAYNVPDNVQHCYLVARSKLIGSRNTSMNYVGTNWESGQEISSRIELPGSHAAMGGFPNERGTFDGPIGGQGDPAHPSEFHPRKEVTATWEAGNFISIYAMKAGVLKSSLVGQKPEGYLYNKLDWYRVNLP